MLGGCSYANSLRTHPHPLNGARNTHSARKRRLRIGLHSLINVSFMVALGWIGFRQSYYVLLSREVKSLPRRYLLLRFYGRRPFARRC